MANDVNSSFQDLMTFLRSFSLEANLSNASLEGTLKKVHKRLYALLCWQLELGPHVKEDHIIWLNECVSDFVQCIPLLAQGFYKGCTVLHRSAIENAVKFVLVKNGGSLSNITLVHQLFNEVKNLPCCQNPEVKERIDSLRNIYSELSYYVHSSGKPFMALAHALNQYPAVDEELLQKIGSDMVRSLHKINGLLFVLERPIFNKMYHGNREAILDILTSSEKRRLI